MSGDSTRHVQRTSCSHKTAGNVRRIGESSPSEITFVIAERREPPTHPPLSKVPLLHRMTFSLWPWRRAAAARTWRLHRVPVEADIRT
jgi:hypothetical protein